ncbi:MAG TPA: DUF1549 domain-containing protein [Pirellulales bacterium]|nr:DUF1549 domain-containing protein [Pirellulales bacterium]
MSKRQTLFGGCFGRRVAISGVGLGSCLLTFSIFISAEAATPTTVSSEVSTNSSASAGDAEKPAATASAIIKPATGRVLPGSSIPQVEIINDAVRKGWSDHHLTPSPLATEGEWCRRIFLDVIGRIPSVEELNRFLGDKTVNRRMNLVDRLLGKDYVEEYARNWSGIWTNLLIGRPGNRRQDERLPTDRDGMEQYLRRAFELNKPYRKMVYELVSATGATKPGEDNYNGAVNFLVGKMDEGGLQATAKTAQIFLGLSVQCTQCHDHPFNEWKQNQFWQMNAFFRQTKMNKTMGPKRTVEHAVLSNQDYRGEQGGMDSAEIYYEQRNGNMRIAYPVFVDGTEISRSGSLRENDRRTELAKLIVKSDYMSKAIVNRMWGHFFSYAFTKPVDDMVSNEPPSHPELLDQLAAEFSKHRYEDDGYDLKQLIRWIVLSEPYALSSRITRANHGDDPTLGEKPQFSHFYIRQMTAEQLYESMLTATGLDANQSESERGKTKVDWLQQFVITFGTDDGGQASTFNGSIPQTLMMFNGNMMQRATMGEKGTLLDFVANNPKLSPADKVNYLYLAGLARRPNDAEKVALRSDVVDVKKDPIAPYQDLWWAILNSNEFILNH